EPNDSEEPVLALRDGRVVLSRWTDQAYGHYVVTEHEHEGVRFRVWYCHMDDRYVSAGDVLEQGQPVGELGATGGNWAEHVHINLEVPGRGLAGYVVRDVVDPAPHISMTPAPVGVDMARYFLPAHEFGDIVILKNNWGADDERVQLQREGNTSYITKNQLYEERVVNERGIWTVVDTSPEEGLFYRVEGGPFFPRYWMPGDKFRRTETVTFYRKADCSKWGEPFTWTSDIVFERLHEAWTSPGGERFEDVVQAAWMREGQWEERYYLAPHRGYVMWENRAGRRSFAVDVIRRGEQDDNQREVIPCL
ncbi:MAG: M23 family metallopeptidase, partial [Chloroflexota bacterium]